MLTTAPCLPCAVDQERLVAFVGRVFRATGGATVMGQPLRGGSDGAAVVRVQARYTDAAGRRHNRSFVVKCLEGSQRREATIYEQLLAPGRAGSPGNDAHDGRWLGWPRLLGVEPVGPTTTYLYLEHITPVRRWPWRETALAGTVLEQLAYVHTALEANTAPGVLSIWNYETEVLASAQRTVTALEAWARRARHAPFAGAPEVLGLPAVRRVASALPVIRRQVFTTTPFGVTVIHGDAHPGNAMLQRQGGAVRPVLLDWGRARLGSPLEDVSSWLESLGFWEPEAKRRHDTLLRRYLSARGRSRHLDPDLRHAYWLAAASNVLAGALRSHVAIADGWGQPSARARAQAMRSVGDDLRVLRRADAVWRR